MSRFIGYEEYVVQGKYLVALEQIAKRLDDPASLTLDQRRDDANLIHLMLSDAFNLPSSGPDAS